MARSTPSTLSSNRDYILSWHDSFLFNLRIFLLWTAVAILLSLQTIQWICAGKNKYLQALKSSALARAKKLISRFYFGAMFTVVMYSLGALLAQVKVCTPGTVGPIDGAACAVQIVTNESAVSIKNRFALNTTLNATSIAVAEESTLDVKNRNSLIDDMPMEFAGGFQVFTHRKKCRYSFLLWMPEYECVRYCVKALVNMRIYV